MPAAMQSWHRGRMKADMCCRRAWLISSKGIRPISVASSIVSAFCPALAVPLQAHTPAPGYPAPQTRHPRGEALLGLVGLSLLVPTHNPGGLGLPRQRGGQSWRGKELASAREVAPLPCPPALSLSALRCLSVPRPLPAARRPGGAESSCPFGAGAVGKAASAPLHPHPTPATRIPTRAPHTATTTGARLGPGRDGAAPGARSSRGGRGEPPGRPSLPGPGHLRAAPRERGAGAAHRGGSCHGVGTIKPGVIAFRQMRLLRPSPSPGI